MPIRVIENNETLTTTSIPIKKGIMNGMFRRRLKPTSSFDNDNNNKNDVTLLTLSSDLDLSTGSHHQHHSRRLSTGSLSGSSNHSLISISTCSSQQSVSNQNTNKRTALRSCMKGSRFKEQEEIQQQQQQQPFNNNSSRGGRIRRISLSSKQKKKQNRVQFKSSSRCYTFYKVDSYVEYATSIWWTKNELDLCRQEQTNYEHATSDVIEHLRQYLVAYQTARDELYYNSATETDVSSNTINNSNNSMSCNYSERSATTATNSTMYSDLNSTNDTNNVPTLSNEVYHQIAVGYARGYNGIERYIGKETQVRRKHVRKITSLIVNYYESINTFHDKTSDDDDDVTAVIGSYAKSLTSIDRYWSLAMGNAAYLAAEPIYQQK